MASEADQLLEIAVAVNSARGLDEIARVVLSRVGELLPFDRASIALADPTETHLTVREFAPIAGHRKNPRERGKRIPIDDTNLLGWVFKQKKPHMRKSLEEARRFQPQQDGRQVASHIIVPLVGRERSLGVFCVGSFEPDRYTDRLVSLLTGYARLTAVAIENLRLYEQAKELSLRDGLTGAYNHRFLMESIDRMLEESKRYNRPFSLLLLDIDDFKGFNDEYGHQAGDKILTQTVNILRNYLRASDSVYRYGGEEFGVLLPSTDADDAFIVASRLAAALREENTYQPSVSQPWKQVTASIGVSTAPKDAHTVESLVACSDQAMYRAKAGGRDRIVVFSQIEEVQRLQAELARITPFTLADRGKGRPFQAVVDGLPMTRNQRVVELAEMMADALDLDPVRRENLRIAAVYHDVGEIGIPEELLDRPGPLNAREIEMVRKHPIVGESFLRRAIQIGEVLMAVLHHHERYDGTGAPRGLKGEEIPLKARILSVVEVFEALTSRRPYREAFETDEAYGILRELAGSQLDPSLVETFIDAHRRHDDLAVPA